MSYTFKVEVPLKIEQLIKIKVLVSNYSWHEEIIDFLLNGEYDDDEFAHGYNFMEGTDLEIIMWQPLEHFTLGQLRDQL